MKKATLLIILFCSFLGCKKNIQEQKENIKKPELSIAVDFPKPDNLDQFSKKNITNWKEYEIFNSFLERFDKISPNEALNYAIELKDLIVNLKDSLKPKILKNNAFNTRLNVLENEALRLVDMTYISAIKAEEVNTQILKIIEVFGSVNQKINTLYSQKRFEDAILIDDNNYQTDTLPVIKERVKKQQNKPNTKNLKKLTLGSQNARSKFKKIPTKKDN
ncbi:hypothetical protein LPB136_12485 [Tenacibaculum todarodis]|uniref:Lipoprotein n=1 Tax=Tenacibaculum todarodis TaxID=1850252 RepID=A0A1L3JLY0_9FLAO|nr:hypothetical protein [Tenacibaculum todarodis]APG66137.1 hypothetical protein LPB136_12485 [Tenacibaculum todarodis]